MERVSRSPCLNRCLNCCAFLFTLSSSPFPAFFPECHDPGVRQVRLPQEEQPRQPVHLGQAPPGEGMLLLLLLLPLLLLMLLGSSEHFTTRCFFCLSALTKPGVRTRFGFGSLTKPNCLCPCCRCGEYSSNRGLICCAVRIQMTPRSLSVPVPAIVLVVPRCTTSSRPAAGCPRTTESSRRPP